MAKVAGKEGSITFAGITAGIKNWTLNIEADTLDTTDFNSGGDKEYITGLKGWSGTFEGDYDTANTAQVGDTGAATFTVTSGKAYSGNIIIKSIRHKQDVTDKATVVYEFQGTGPLTYPS